MHPDAKDSEMHVIVLVEGNLHLSENGTSSILLAILATKLLAANTSKNSMFSEIVTNKLKGGSFKMFESSISDLLLRFLQ